MQLFVWMIRTNGTLGYITAVADTVEGARARLLATAQRVRETTTDGTFKEGEMEYTYRSTNLGARDGVLHLTGTECLTTEEFCEQQEVVERELAKDPLHVAPVDSCIFALSNFS